MRVLQIMAGRRNGGAELYSTDIMLSLHEAGLDQRVVLHPKAPRFAELAGAGLNMAPEVLAVPIRPWQRQRLRRVIAAYQPDIIHCWMRRAASLVPAQAAPAIIGWYGDYEAQEAHFAHCTHFIGVTQDLVRHAEAHGAKPGTAFYVPTFPSVVEAPPIDRAMLDTPPDAAVLLTLSRLHKVKGLDTALHALAALPSCYLWIAGDGPEEAALRQLAAELGVAGRVRFLGWRTDRGALLRSADICLLPSRYEPFGTVILDAWSMATPFIACASDGPSAYIRNGENGMLVPADEPAALAGAISAVLGSEELRQSIASTGHAEYLAGFTRAVVTQRMLETYKSILETVHAA
jgi:glycosyltransferase involved in cell wall biosynthesis